VFGVEGLHSLARHVPDFIAGNFHPGREQIGYKSYFDSLRSERPDRVN